MTISSSGAAQIAALDTAQGALDKASAIVSSGNRLLQPWVPELIQLLALSVLLFSFGALLLGTLLLWRYKAQGNQILRVFGIISIIGMSAFLLVVGYSNDQLTPIVGLFGAISGYLLGKEGHKDREDPESSVNTASIPAVAHRAVPVSIDDAVG